MSAANPQVVIETSLGTIEVELFADKAPLTVANILSYVDEGYYDGTIFHRVIPNFMVQCGGFEPGMRQKKTKGTIKNESANGLQNKRGTLAMARTPAPDSASSQFFINTVDNGFLDRAQAADGVGYCVFGRVTSGMDVVDKMQAAPSGNVAGHGNVPNTDIVVKSVKRK
jgi:cyclophilin family peptidyl-prolyl cis-trans isomerase